MNHRRFFIAFSLLLLGETLVWEREARAQGSKTDLDGLKQILEELGYAPKEVKSNESIAWEVQVKHPGGETRRHLLGMDPKAATIFIIGGGFSSWPDPGKATSAWYRKVMHQNHKISPSYIFLNDFDVFGLTTVLGNVDIDAARIKAKITEHATNFDEKLVPLIKEVPSKDDRK